jgi:hypothetical protein
LSYKQIVPAISFKGVFFNGKLMHDFYQAAKKEWVGDSLEFLVFPKNFAATFDFKATYVVNGVSIYTWHYTTIDKLQVRFFLQGSWRILTSITNFIHRLLLTAQQRRVTTQAIYLACRCYPLPIPSRF